MINFVVIGTNFITDKLIDAVNKCDGLNLYGVYSRSYEKGLEFGKKYNVTNIYTDLNNLANDKNVDAVYIASPNGIHYKQAKIMLSNKKHVLCEKTIVSNSYELQDIINLAYENNVVLLEAMRSTFDEGFKSIKDNIHKLGKIRGVFFEYCQYSSRYDKYKNGIIENAFKQELSNGALTDIGVYCVHPLVDLFGLPNEISSVSTKLETGVDGAGVITAKYNDMIAILSYSKISQGYIPNQIQGENGTMIISKIADPDEVIINYRNGEGEVIHKLECNNNMIYEVKEWKRLIEEKEIHHKYIQNSINALKIMDTVRKQNNILFSSDSI